MSIRDRASAIKRSHRAEIGQIRGDASLSESGRRDAIAATWERARGQLDQLRAQHQAEEVQERRRLERSVFGPPPGGDSVTISYRDALDRVTDSVKSSDDAAVQMRRALRRGDEVMAKAVLTVAVERSWGAAIEIYGEEHPEAAEAVGDYVSFQRATSSREERMAADMLFSLPQPAELSGGVV